MALCARRGELRGQTTRGRSVHVQRQVAIVGSLVFALPRTGSARRAAVVAARGAAAAYLQEFPAQTVVLPWETPGGRPVEAQLLLVSREGKPLN
jgi:hypothetical protein